MTAIPHPLHSAAAHHDDAHAHHELGFAKKYIFSVDHKIIGLQFLFLGLMFFVIGGLEAMLVRWQLGWPGRAVPVLGAYMKAMGAAGWADGSMPPDFYTQTFTMHASIMIFFVIIPLLVGTFGNYLIPLQIGAGDMAFPFLNGLAFWSAMPAGAIIVASFFLPGGPAAAGWTSYPALSEIWANGALNSKMLVYAPPSGGIEGLAMFLRVHDAGAGTMSTWPAFALFTTYFATFLSIAYLCAYYVRLGSRPL